MLSIRQLLKGNKGFTLLELLCGLCIGSILLGVCLFILTFSSKGNVYGDKVDELLYNGNFALEYMKNEIQNADKIISSNKIKDLDLLYPNNIGFVIMEYQPGDTRKEKYVFITYYVKDNSLVRLSRRLLTDKYPNGQVLSESNEICEYAIDVGDTTLDWENKILNLKLSLGDENIDDSYKSTIFLHCSLDY